MPYVVWAEKSKTGLGFEIGPSYDDVPTTSQCVTDGQSNCITLRVKPVIHEANARPRANQASIEPQTMTHKDAIRVHTTTCGSRLPGCHNPYSLQVRG